MSRPHSGKDAVVRKEDVGRPRIALVIPHGVAARNFLLSGFLENLLRQADVAVIHTLGPGLESHLGKRDSGASWYAAPSFREDPVSLLVRKSFQVAHMRVCGTTAMAHILEDNRPGARTFRRTPRADAIAWHLSRVIWSHRQLRSWTRFYARRQSRGKAAQEVAAIFAKLEPDLVLCCDQRFPLMAPVVAVARRRRVPVGTFIFSWDNLSSKGRMPCEFDFYCVWSDLMKTELLRFYPYVTPDSVHITGTPQFEPYRDQARRSTREALCARLGADPKRPIICFSGEDLITDVENPQHLEVLCRLIREGAIEGNPQVVLRPAPSDGHQRWEDVRRRYPELIWSPPAWSGSADSAWTARMPTEEDVNLLTDLVQNCDCCVNMCSTMTLDFALGGKPTVNIAFDVASPPPHGIPIWDRYFQFEHYRPVVDLGAALIARNPEELARHVNAALRDPDVTKSGREALIALQTNETVGVASEAFVSCLMARVETRIQRE